MKNTSIIRWMRTLSQQQGQEELRKRVLTCLDYSMQTGPARPLLSKCLTSRSKVVRALATRHMRALLRAGVSNFSVWAIDFLVKQVNQPQSRSIICSACCPNSASLFCSCLQLSDTDRQVTHEALSILEEASDDIECLVNQRPLLKKNIGACADLRVTTPEIVN